MGIILSDNEFLPQAFALIDSAKREITLSTFKAEITTKPRGKALADFFKKVIEKAKSGLRVRLILNWNTDRRSCPKTNLYVMQELKKHNIKVKFLRNNRCAHAKIIMADRERAIIGSHNLSVKSCHNNFELSFLTTDPDAVQRLSTIFDHSWNDAQKY